MLPDETRPQARAASGAPPRLSALTGRLGLALVAGVLLAIVAYAFASTVLADPALRLVIATFLAMGAAGAMLHLTVVRPLIEDSTELHGRYEAAMADALTDPLTGLGNHRAFQEELERQVEQAHRYAVPVSLILIDIDEFKTVNDDRGHAAGDRTLARFGQLVRSSVRRVDRGFRIGGDEFAILLPHTEAENAWVVGRRLLATALQPPLREADEREGAISFSAGISAVPELAATREQLFSQADAALYRAKRAGRTDVLRFDPAQLPAQPSAGEQDAIREVIARGQLRPAYQPIVALETMSVIGHEGLIRPVAPAPFADPASLFAAAAASGHLAVLDTTCIDTIVAGAASLPADQFLSVNVSPQTIEAPEFSSAVLLGILARHGFPPARLVLELTEHEEIGDIERLRAKVEPCRRAGIRLAADDLGAGNAGLRLLADLRFDLLKVDLSLVQRAAPDAPSAAVVGSVVALAGRTGALVIGEGVEEPEDLRQLAALGVGAGQGYFFGRPGPLADAAPRAGENPLRPARPTAPITAWRQSMGLPSSAGS